MIALAISSASRAYIVPTIKTEKLIMTLLFQYSPFFSYIVDKKGVIF